MTDKTTEDILKSRSEAKWPPIMIATQGMVDYDKLIKYIGGELVKPGDGYTFDPFKDADPEQIEAFIEAYCAPYPAEFSDIIREKVRKEIEGRR